MTVRGMTVKGRTGRRTTLVAAVALGIVSSPIALNSST